MMMAETKPPWRHERRRLPGHERHEQIMQAACALIAERGYWGLSMQDVADRCGLTVPGLLRHTGSKVGLLIAVLDHRDVQDARALGACLGIVERRDTDAADQADDEATQAAPRPGPRPRISLRQFCAAMMQRNAAQPEIVRLYAVLKAESLAPSHPAHDYFEARQQRTLEQFARLAKGGSTRPDAMARQVLAAMDGIQLQWLRSPDSFDLVGAWQDAADVLFASQGE